MILGSRGTEFWGHEVRIPLLDFFGKWCVVEVLKRYACHGEQARPGSIPSFSTTW